MPAASGRELWFGEGVGKVASSSRIESSSSSTGAPAVVLPGARGTSTIGRIAPPAWMGHHCVNSQLRRAFNVVVGDEIVGSAGTYIPRITNLIIPNRRNYARAGRRKELVKGMKEWRMALAEALMGGDRRYDRRYHSLTARGTKFCFGRR
ncbi:hypothetical protein C8R48DRAFT_671616 [Suillus tomentosus]|nr:hypothetical protein C8R48DRAFT_671616 [Suillus tomentosus]